MSTVNILEAKTHLSRLIEALESGAEQEVVIARNGRPAARLVPIERGVGMRLGVARGAFEPPEPDPALDAEIERLFGGS